MVPLLAGGGMFETGAGAFFSLCVFFGESHKKNIKSHFLFWWRFVV